MSRAGTRIERVRLHGDALDATQSRLKLGALLAGADVRPSGLAPSALLCVRRVADPLPGALRLDTPDARPPPEWERAFVGALERALRSAARPAREAVPAGAEAVLFADRAELLACLARDARDGTMWTRWWWRSLSPDLSMRADPVVEAWLETPEHVPAALELLAARSEAAAFVAALPLAAAARIVERVLEAFGLVELARAVAAGATPLAARRTIVAVATTGGAVRPAPPWRASVPESTASALAPPRELLLGVALALRRTPAAVRAPVFARDVHEWLAFDETDVRASTPKRTIALADRVESVAPVTVEAPPTGSPAPDAVAAQPPELAPRPAAEPSSPMSIPPQPDRAADTPPAAGATAVLRASIETGASESATLAPPSEPPSETSTPTPRRRPTPPLLPPRPRAASRRRAPAQPRRKVGTLRRPPEPLPLPEPEPFVDPAAPEPSPLPVETALGGVFYLLNLALFLGLYGDFTQPRKPGIALDPWDFLALVAPRLLDEPVRDDALWSLLARLAARGPRDRPGRAFRPPRAWRTPRAWLEPFDAHGDWRWSAADGTLRIVHPAGFAVAAVPRTDEPPRIQLERELRKLPRPRPIPRRATLPREPSQPLARWVTRVAAYAGARLRLALDLAATDSLDAVLLRRHARVLVSPTHVDVVLGLDELPLEVRFAGLDRTPGWIPATGRFVALHFE